MSKKMNILLLVVSTCILLITPFIPHHHHEGVACAVTEYCEQDRIYNDAHTDHQDTSKEPSSDVFCFENASYLSTNAGAGFHFENSFTFRALASFLISSYDLQLGSDVEIRVARLFCEYILTYQSAEIPESNGLRAPPFFKA